MKTAMESIREMVDVNTIVGDAVQTVDGTVIIPVSKVTFGFAAGGGDCGKGDNKNQESKFPFAGGSGAGVSINPVAFLVVGRNDTIRMIPASFNNPLDRLLEIVPNAIDQIKKTLTGKEAEKLCRKKENGNENGTKEEEKKCEKQDD